jgi:hypothetical protein
MIFKQFATFGIALALTFRMDAVTLPSETTIVERSRVDA